MCTLDAFVISYFSVKVKNGAYMHAQPLNRVTHNVIVLSLLKGGVWRQNVFVNLGGGAKGCGVPMWVHCVH